MRRRRNKARDGAVAGLGEGATHYPDGGLKAQLTVRRQDGTFMVYAGLVPAEHDGAWVFAHKRRSGFWPRDERARNEG